MASLVADYSSSSESESDTETDTDSVVEEPDKNNSSSSEKLPRPEFGSSGTVSLKNSVFSNPFVEAENAKKAILEKHVKMTPTRDETKMINGKKICWNFRKGRCRFGHNCKFAHDSDLHQSNSDLQNESDNPNNEQMLPLQNQVIPIVDENIDIDNENISSMLNKKKRPGLSQNLVPGKKVMKMYKKQQVKKDVSWGMSRGNR